jgi:hypothetical protein
MANPFNPGDIVRQIGDREHLEVLDPECERYKSFRPRCVVRTTPNKHRTEYFFEDTLELVEAAKPLSEFDLAVRAYVKGELHNDV